MHKALILEILLNVVYVHFLDIVFYNFISPVLILMVLIYWYNLLLFMWVRMQPIVMCLIILII